MLGNIKKFSGLTQREKILISAVIGAPLVIVALTAYWFMPKADIRVALRVSPTQEVLLQACADNYAARTMDFSETTDVATGCACAAKLVSSVTPAAHYPAYGAVHALVLDSQHWTVESENSSVADLEKTTRIDAGLETIAQTNKSHVSVMRHMFDYMVSSQSVCDIEQSYQGEQLEALAALTPLQTPIWVVGSEEGVVELSLRGARSPIRLSMNAVSN